MSEEEISTRKLTEVPAGCVGLKQEEYRNEFGRFWCTAWYDNTRRIKDRAERPGLYDGELDVLYRGSL